MIETHTKEFIFLRGYLLGRGYTNALKALEVGAEYHNGTRKDGTTPEYNHQVQMCEIIRTFGEHLDRYESTLIAACLHDVAEDHDVNFDEIYKHCGWDDDARDAVYALTYKFKGGKKDNVMYYNEIGENQIASVVKGVDRLHNLYTMGGVFDIEKQYSYIAETEEFVIPMLRRAKRLFPSQEKAYYAILYHMRGLIKLTKHNLDLTMKLASIPVPSAPTDGKVKYAKDINQISSLMGNKYDR